MPEVVRFDAKPVAEVVAILEDMLERARSGDVIGVAVATACSGSCDGSAYAIGLGSVAQLVCGIERVKLRLLHEED